MTIIIGDIPSELRHVCHEYVAVFGLDVVNNALHNSVWDAFVSHRRPDRLPLYFRTVSKASDFPKAKPKRPAGDLGSPRGLIKHTWVAKHLYAVPCLVVLFIDLDWNHPAWNEKKTECASKVESIRHSLEKRNTRLAVVLIQANPPLPPGEDVLAAERATELCNACDLSPKSLFVLPHTDHLFGYILRLEHAFYELGQGYYTSEIKRVKIKKDYLNKDKIVHQPLLVRYQFKLGIFHEMKQDSHAALKHYKQAYVHLGEMKWIAGHALELWTVAGLLNFKICKLSFVHNTPLDAISQFRKHIDYYKDKFGHPALQFEQHAWLAKQFEIFADLFELAIQNGLAAIQTQHPGFYYQSSANQTVARRSAMIQSALAAGIPSDIMQNGDLMPSAGQTHESEYFGQRSWRLQSGSPGITDANFDDAAELAGARSELYKERCSADYATAITASLTSAMNHFKRYKCPRMKRFIMVQLAEEYFSQGDFLKALQFLNHTIWEYRSERWWLPLKVILLLAIKCAYCVANVKEYVALCLELLGPWTAFSTTEQERFQSNLLRVWAGNVPEPEPDLDEVTVAKARDKWTHELGERCFFMVQMQHVIAGIEAKCCFLTTDAHADTAVQLVALVRSTCPYPFHFSKLAIHFSNETYNEMCCVTDLPGKNAGVNLTLLPHQLRTFEFEFFPSSEDVGKAIQITSLCLDVGQLHCNVCGTLQWEGGACELVHNMTKEFLASCEKVDPFDALISAPCVRIVPKEPAVRVHLIGEQVVLMNETFTMQLRIENNEAGPIIGLRFIACFVTDGHQTEKSTTLSLKPIGGDGTRGSDGHVFDVVEQQLSDLGENQKVELPLFAQVRHLGERTIRIDVQYEFALKHNTRSQNSATYCRCVASAERVVQVVCPFAVHCRALSLTGDLLDHLVCGEPCVLAAEVKCNAAVPLRIQGITWHLSHNFGYDAQLLEKLAQCLNTLAVVQPNEALTFSCPLTPLHVATDPIGLGALNVAWQRDVVEATDSAFTLVSLNMMPVMFCPVIVSADCAPVGEVRRSVLTRFFLRNMSDTVLQLDVTMDQSEAFMFSGHRQTQIRILPGQVTALQYLLLPLLAGQVGLPRLKLQSSHHAQDVLDTYAQRNVMKVMNILPSSRSDDVIEEQIPVPVVL